MSVRFCLVATLLMAGTALGEAAERSPRQDTRGQGQQQIFSAERRSSVWGDAVVGLDASAAKVVNENSDTALNLGVGIAARSGWRFHFGAFSVTPEFMIDFTHWGGTLEAQQRGIDSMWMLGLLPGAQLGLDAGHDGSVTAWFGAHLGYVHAGASGASCALSCGGEHFGLRLDTGVGFRIANQSTLGPLVSFNLSTNGDSDAIKWLTFGLGGNFGL
jgi:hypothetical protein